MQAFRASLMVMAFAALLACPAHAQDGKQDIGQAASDPTAALTAFQLQNLYSPTLYNSDQSQNILQFRAALPFELGGTQNIFRITLPYFTDSASGRTGLSDTTVFNLVTFDRSWGRFGLGAAGLFPTGIDGLSAEKWGLGPAAGFTVQKGKLLWGLFNQNIFTVAGDDDMPDVNVSIFQPIVSYGLGNGWSVGNSEMSAAYNWEADQWDSLPLGFKIAKLHKFGTTPVQFTGTYEYDFADDSVSPEETFSFTVKVLIPKG